MLLPVSSQSTVAPRDQARVRRSSRRGLCRGRRIRRWHSSRSRHHGASRRAGSAVAPPPITHSAVHGPLQRAPLAAPRVRRVEGSAKALSGMPSAMTACSRTRRLLKERRQRATAALLDHAEARHEPQALRDSVDPEPLQFRSLELRSRCRSPATAAVRPAPPTTIDPLTAASLSAMSTPMCDRSAVTRRGSARQPAAATMNRSRQGDRTGPSVAGVLAVVTTRPS